MEIKAVLYDASGKDRKIDFEEIDDRLLDDSKLLWVDVRKRDADLLERVADKLELEHVPCQMIVAEDRRPRVASFDRFFSVSIDSCATLEDGPPERQQIDFLVGRNFVVTIHDGTVKYFEEHFDREKGETRIGRLSSESFVASLLDLHIVSYFRAIEYIEKQVDTLDETVMNNELSTDDFLQRMVRLRRWVSQLRTWLLPHRDLVYTFSRSDFTQIAESHAVGHFRLMAEHFESAVAGLESAREKVLGTFSLYATKSDQFTNTFIQRLTFITLIVGGLGVVAGIFGMNFTAEVFSVRNGFLATIIGMVVLSFGLTLFARLRNWI